MKTFGIPNRRGSFRNLMLVAFATLASIGGILQATPLLINIDAGPGLLQTGTAVLGFSSGDVWNSIDNATNPTGNDTFSGLVDSGNHPLAGVGFTRSGAAYNGSGSNTDITSRPMDPGTTNLMEDFLWTYNNNVNASFPIVWTLTGLSAYAGNAFTYVIYSAGGDGANSELALASGNGGGIADTSAASRRLSDGPGVAYVLFSGTVDALGQVQFSQYLNPNNAPDFGFNNTPLNGIQIEIVPEPSAGVLLGTGIALAGLFGFANRRKALK